MSKKIFIASWLFLLFSFLWSVQSWVVKAPDSLTVGTIFSAEIYLPSADPAGSIEDDPQIITPIYDTLPDLSLLDMKVIAEEKGLKLSHKFIFTSGGLVSLPSLEFEYQDAKGERKKISSDSYPFIVHSLLDTTIKDIADIRPPKSLYLGVLEYLSIVLFCLFVFFLVKILPYFMQKKHLEEIDRKVVDNRPAWQAGLESLQKAEESLQKGNLLEYFFRLSFALRIFLEKTYNISATQMTTDELKGLVKLPEISAHNKLFEIFAYADLVKFAKYAGNKLLADEYFKWVKELFLQAKTKEMEQQLFENLPQAKESCDV